jgi:hypothetical protein
MLESKRNAMRCIGVLLLASTVAFGQRAAGGHAGGMGHVGGGHAFASSSHASTYGSITSSVVHAGQGSTLNTHLGVGRFRNRTGAVIYVPYAVGGYYGGYYYGDQGAPLEGGYPQQQYMGPPVIINQNFAPDVARPVVREYVTDANGGIRVYGPQSAVSEPETPVAEESPTFLIAFKDHTIYAALAYWVEGETLHYVTNQNTHNQVSLDLIDRELSERLNRERQVNFRLPLGK